MACKICEHAQRADIEAALFASDYGTGTESISLQDIAKQYKVSVQDLQVHALMHTPMTQLEDAAVGASISASVKKREADLLAQAAQEYFNTLKLTGRQLRSVLSKEDGTRYVTKPAVDLYLGVGVNLRQTLESLVDMNLKVNGEQDAGAKAIVDLVSAIRGSKDK